MTISKCVVIQYRFKFSANYRPKRNPYLELAFYFRIQQAFELIPCIGCLTQNILRHYVIFEVSRLLFMRLAHNEKGYASLCLKIYVEDMFFCAKHLACSNSRAHSPTTYNERASSLQLADEPHLFIQTSLTDALFALLFHKKLRNQQR